MTIPAMKDRYVPHQELIRDYLWGSLNADEFRTRFIEFSDWAHEDDRINGDDIRAEVSHLRGLLNEGNLSLDEYQERRAQLWGYNSWAELNLICDTDTICRFTATSPEDQSHPRPQEVLDAELLAAVQQLWAKYRKFQEGGNIDDQLRTANF